MTTATPYETETRWYFTTGGYKYQLLRHLESEDDFAQVQVAGYGPVRFGVVQRDGAGKWSWHNPSNSMTNAILEYLNTHGVPWDEPRGWPYEKCSPEYDAAAYTQTPLTRSWKEKCDNALELAKQGVEAEVGPVRPFRFPNLISESEVAAAKARMQEGLERQQVFKDPEVKMAVLLYYVRIQLAATIEDVRLKFKPLEPPLSLGASFNFLRGSERGSGQTLWSYSVTVLQEVLEMDSTLGMAGLKSLASDIVAKAVGAMTK